MHMHITETGKNHIRIRKNRNTATMFGKLQKQLFNPTVHKSSGINLHNLLSSLPSKNMHMSLRQGVSIFHRNIPPTLHSSRSFVFYHILRRLSRAKSIILTLW